MHIFGMRRCVFNALAIVLLALSLSGCANNSTQKTGTALGPGGGPVLPGTPREFSVKVGSLVYFTTDSAKLTPEAQSTLRAQSQWLKRYPQFTITLEGHADERGTREYNLGLGAKRATAVRDFLRNEGINPSRMRTISYGKERPVAVCDDISCWSQNRRVETKLNSRAGS